LKAGDYRCNDRRYRGNTVFIGWVDSVESNNVRFD